MESEKIQCPLMDEKIDGTVCFDICMVAEGMAPVWTAPEGVIETDNYKEMCMNCKNHRD